jgi:hypothetical protein
MYSDSPLCSRSEITRWTCTNKQRTFSLCSSQTASRTTGYLQPRVERWKTDIFVSRSKSPAPRSTSVIRVSPPGASGQETEITCGLTSAFELTSPCARCPILACRNATDAADTKGTVRATPHQHFGVWSGNATSRNFLFAKMSRIIQLPDQTRTIRQCYVDDIPFAKKFYDVRNFLFAKMSRLIHLPDHTRLIRQRRPVTSSSQKSSAMSTCRTRPRCNFSHCCGCALPVLHISMVEA